MYAAPSMPAAGSAGTPPQPKARFEIIDGGEVALEVFQAIGFRTTLKSATIVSYALQDYDFSGQGLLSQLLLRQLSLGASIRLVTTPPMGRATKADFQRKYRLLSQLQKKGIAVFVNEKLHAKAYLFVDTNDTATAIVGSVNLTGPGFGIPHTPNENLVEMAVVTEDSHILNDCHSFVDTKIMNDRRTLDFGTWFAANIAAIGAAGLI